MRVLEKQGLVYMCDIYFKEMNTKAQRAEDEVHHLSTGICLLIKKKGFKYNSVMVLEERD